MQSAWPSLNSADPTTAAYGITLDSLLPRYLVPIKQLWVQPLALAPLTCRGDTELGTATMYRTTGKNF